jgi:hypothetical protein
MRVLLAFCVLMLSTMTYAQNITAGWQLLGASSDMNVSKFDGKCIDYVWVYDQNSDKWKLHVANGNNYNYQGEYIDSIKKNQGFWVKANGNCDVSLDDGLVFTKDMLDGKRLYYVFVHSEDVSRYGYYERTFQDNIMTTGDEYGNMYNDRNITLDGSHLLFNYYDYFIDYNLVGITDDYYKISGKAVSEINSSKISYFDSYFYFDKQKAIDFIKQYEVYDNTFFDGNSTFSNLDVTEHYTPERYNLDNGKLNFKNYEIEGNSYTINNDSITLVAVPSGDNSRMKISLRDRPVFNNGIAAIINSGTLDDNHRNRIQIKQNAYNDGEYDVSFGVTVLKDKIVYYGWRENAPESEQTLKNWTPILENQDFNNKDVKIAEWIKDGKMHFYAECDGKIGYKELEINSSYLSNPFEDSHWRLIEAQVRDGGTNNMVAKVKKLYIIR